MKIYSVYTDEFKLYGKILQNYDTQSLISAMRTIPMPESGTAYEPSISALEESGIFDAMQNRAYGGMPVQIGMCWVSPLRRSTERPPCPVSPGVSWW